MPDTELTPDEIKHRRLSLHCEEQAMRERHREEEKEMRRKRGELMRLCSHPSDKVDYHSDAAGDSGTYRCSLCGREGRGDGWVGESTQQRLNYEI